MKYYSLNKNAPNASFKEAVVRGIAPDKGLYFPTTITKLENSFIENIEHYSNHEIAFKVIKQFVGNEIPEKDLASIIEDVLNFDFPLVEIEPNIYALELFHGPTMAFKDVGARFMARCLGYFNKQDEKVTNITVLVATSGDTGGAVASGFLGVEGVKVVILYPSGKVSDIQEKQLTTLGQNITALEVNGTFDDCQAMVKNAFLDLDITKQLTSANSINVARWLPQMFYFFFAYRNLKIQGKKLTFSVPSGNFGNICAGMMAQQLGLPIHHFVAATNINKVVSNYLDSGIYKPKPSIATISNAMDVGDPSNFIRIQEIYKNNIELLKVNLSSYSFSDDETRKAMKTILKDSNYIADPHGAIGYLGCKMHLKNNDNTNCVFLETAHPVKFLDVLDLKTASSIKIPTQIKAVINKDKEATLISTYTELKNYLIHN